MSCFKKFKWLNKFSENPIRLVVTSEKYPSSETNQVNKISTHKIAAFATPFLMRLNATFCLPAAD